MSGVPVTVIPTPRVNSNKPWSLRMCMGQEAGVLVHTEYGGNVFDQRETLAWSGFTFGNRWTDLGGDLIVEWDRLCTVDVDFQHGPSHSSSVVELWEEEK